MPNIKIELLAEMADGATHQVVADQRDFAKWEIQEFADNSVYQVVDGKRMETVQSRTHLKTRFLGWSAMTRQGLTSVPFDKFNEVDCIEVNSPDDENGEGEQGLDPGQTEAGDVSTSISHAGRASRSRKSSVGTPAI